MSKHFEVIFEDGDHSILAGEQEDVVRFAQEHHQRAKSGLAGGPAGHRAVRIVRILEYPQHPLDLAPDAFTLDEAHAMLDSVDDTEDGVVHAPKLQMLFRRPALVNSAPHESNFRAEESAELDPALWGGE